MRFLSVILASLIASLPLQSIGDEQRVFEFTYEIVSGDLPAGEAVDIYIPLPAEHADQRILEQALESSVPGKTGVEKNYDNGYYRITRPAGSDAPIKASLSWTVVRNTVRAGSETALSDAERARFLAPNALVPVGHEVLQPILEEIHLQRSDDSPSATARAIYDWIVDNVEYKKVGTGWGNGDTFWACSERYGNCTDFHALFVALARSEGIPARFEIGFPVPQARPAGDVGGYHCWVQFYIPGEGWIPIDASEAAKHPEKRELFYGTHPADRIHFTTGRDLVVSEASEKQPLNYFIYPYVEVGGKPWQGKVNTRFSYREFSEPTLAYKGES
ncbi:transglutaminase domain-containing protein [Seongchinamella sediminis]|uniref:Transglutaminase domain-containing protein n=1 Tax=Seongchinamella sediminis TaxID=2283635 RepID=A0A3L7DVU5_9GAMM|nr:transglutaminase-like domain-containing protein [Seongchinamella sediminis]RLQ20720.1 transglutaminase domain-containing protein [Seongchinamella sediminis]